MKKFFNSFKFVFKALLLIMLLLVGWAFVNVANLIKGKKTQEKTGDLEKLFGANKANADIPDPNCSYACPHVAYFDGKKFVIENDFLCGSFKNSSIDFLQIPVFVREKFLRPDLLKFTAVPQRRDGKLMLQLQENEAEESFIQWLRIIRVVHSKKSEVMIDANFKTFHVWNSGEVERIISFPERVLRNRSQDVTARFQRLELLRDTSPETDLVLERGDQIEFFFMNLPIDIPLSLLVKSVYRDWMPGEARPINFSQLAALFRGDVRTTLRAVAAIGGAFFFLSGHAAADALALTPIIFGAQRKSIRFSYEDGQGIFRLAAINKPRAWNYGTEAVALPVGVVRKDGSMRIRAEFTKRHKLAFAGILKNPAEDVYREETLAVSRATSSRIGEVTELLSSANNEYLRMIPGDKIDVEFRDPSIVAGENEKETYLFQSFGYYTLLSPEGKKLAGNWREKLEPEAKAHYEKLSELRSYN